MKFWGKTVDSLVEWIPIGQLYPCLGKAFKQRKHAQKDNTPFWNLLHISPVRNTSGKIAYFVEVQIEEGVTYQGGHGLSPDLRQLSVVGAVKVAIRTQSIATCSSSSKMQWLNYQKRVK